MCRRFVVSWDTHRVIKGMIGGAGRQLRSWPVSEGSRNADLTILRLFQFWMEVFLDDSKCNENRIN